MGYEIGNVSSNGKGQAVTNQKKQTVVSDFDPTKPINLIYEGTAMPDWFRTKIVEYFNKPEHANEKLVAGMSANGMGNLIERLKLAFVKSDINFPLESINVPTKEIEELIKKDGSFDAKDAKALASHKNDPIVVNGKTLGQVIPLSVANADYGFDPKDEEINAGNVKLSNWSPTFKLKNLSYDLKNKEYTASYTPFAIQGEKSRYKEGAKIEFAESKSNSAKIQTDLGYLGMEISVIGDINTKITGTGFSEYINLHDGAKLEKFVSNGGADRVVDHTNGKASYKSPEYKELYD